MDTKRNKQMTIARGKRENASPYHTSNSIKLIRPGSLSGDDRSFVNIIVVVAPGLFRNRRIRFASVDGHTRANERRVAARAPRTRYVVNQSRSPRSDLYPPVRFGSLALKTCFVCFDVSRLPLPILLTAFSSYISA